MVQCLLLVKTEGKYWLRTCPVCRGDILQFEFASLGNEGPHDREIMDEHCLCKDATPRDCSMRV